MTIAEQICQIMLSEQLSDAEKLDSLHSLIPAVRPGTVIMLQDVPLTAAPWGSNYWFDLLRRLSYPNVEVAGSYSFTLADPQSPAIAPIIKSGAQS